MRHTFDFETYWEILGRLLEERPCLRFLDFAEQNPEGAFFILRHDVDYSPHAALDLAEQEAGRSVRATYFLLTGTRYYNLMAPGQSHVPRRLIELGHEVGLHYDVNSFDPFPRADWPRLLRAQASLLSELAGVPVRSIAMHQPALNGQDPFRSLPLGFINAYEDRFNREMTYVSDSGRAWRNDGWEMLRTGRFPPRLHLSLHPINWAESDRDRATIFHAVHQNLIEDLGRAETELLSRLAVHSGVVEHEERVARGDS